MLSSQKTIWCFVFVGWVNFAVLRTAFGHKLIWKGLGDDNWHDIELIDRLVLNEPNSFAYTSNSK